MKRRPTRCGPYHEGLDRKTLVFINFLQGRVISWNEPTNWIRAGDIHDGPPRDEMDLSLGTGKAYR
jgi:hypothetical protein